MEIGQAHNFIFQGKKEVKRLHVQNRLLKEYEAPIFEEIFEGRRQLSVLDIGSNDGTKTTEWFSQEAVSKVVGLEYNAELAKKAQQKYGNDKFSFYSMNVESSDFFDKMKELMEEKEIQSFDIIYMSLVLMHLSDIRHVLEVVRPLLKEDGQIVIIEADDENSALLPDKKGLLPEFLNILKKDKYSGNREVGNEICGLLEQVGYGNIYIWHESISAGAEEKEKKKDIFTTFFSYLPEDVELLLREEPECEEYQEWAKWLGSNYKKLRRLIVQSDSTIFMGIKILSCTKGER